MQAYTRQPSKNNESLAEKLAKKGKRAVSEEADEKRGKLRAKKLVKIERKKIACKESDKKGEIKLAKKLVKKRKGKTACEEADEKKRRRY